MKWGLAGATALIIATASTASAQLPFAPAWLNGPTVAAGNFQVNYPYPGQCVADTTNFGAMFPGLPACGATRGSSFACSTVGGFPNQSAGGWANCGTVDKWPVLGLNPIVANSVPLAGTPATPKFVYNLLNPLDYTPDKVTFPGADYYEIGLHEANGFQAIATAGLFPNPTTILKCGATGTAACPAVPAGMQWTGIICNIPTGCSCPPIANAAFKASYCAAGTAAAPLVPAGAPLYTQIWGIGQINMGGGPVTTALGFAGGPASDWSANKYVATWPSISLRGTKGTPVVVKWTNEFPNNHVFCPHPEAADWPCAIDRTFMGVKARLDPAVAETQLTGVLPDVVNAFGSPQQPDNSWVTHLHGGEIPPSTDGFAEKWFGNAVTAVRYNDAAKPRYINPPFESPLTTPLRRPAGNSDTYTYPVLQEEALVWFHDHTLGKTHHNVIAGPAGFFPVTEPLKHGPVAAGVCNGAATGQTCEYTWLDPLTVPRDALGVPVYDLFMAIQDRTFNDDGSINFSNGLGQAPPVAPAPPVGATQFTPGVNPQVHPTWVPEYFGDHVLVNGVIWPKKVVAPGWYRIRLVDGSDSRCWQIAFSTTQPAPGVAPTKNVPFWILANDQGYLQKPILALNKDIVMCPGERYELLVNFGALPKANTGVVFMTNRAPAPFPAGITPQAVGSPFAEMNVVMRFDVQPALGAIKSCVGGMAGFNWPVPATAPPTLPCIPDPSLVPIDPGYVDLRPAAATATVRQVYLNERADGTTATPLGMQLNGVPFEYKVTETPRQGSIETWKFINLTVDAHPMHPHLIKHQIVSRQNFAVGAYKARLCGSSTCQPGTSPGLEMQVVPDVTVNLTGAPTLITPASEDGGNKDASVAYPGQVTTMVAQWNARWPLPAAGALPTAPGTASGCTPLAPCAASTFTYEPVTSGPYVWHCHINSHEDSEMMRTSLVVP
jgi:FtsP/CotA-like multicopper oxidase with cupredoxin domain